MTNKTALGDLYTSNNEFDANVTLTVGNTTVNTSANSSTVKVANSSGNTSVQPGLISSAGALTINATAGNLDLGTNTSGRVRLLPAGSDVVIIQKPSARPDMIFERTDTHGDGVGISNISHYGRDSAAASQLYASQTITALSDNAGAETSSYSVELMDAGTQRTSMSLHATDGVFFIGTYLAAYRNTGAQQIDIRRLDTHGDGATICNMIFGGRDSGGVTTYYADIGVIAVSDNNGAEEGAMTFNVCDNGSEFQTRFRIDGDGVKFNGDTAAGNALDDYEEGTWTPNWSSSGSTFNYTSRLGNYTKIGNSVTFQGSIQLAASGNTLSANVLTVTGLPFTALAPGYDVPCDFMFWAATSTYTVVHCFVTQGTSTLSPRATGSSATTNDITGTAANALLHATNQSQDWFSGAYLV